MIENLPTIATAMVTAGVTTLMTKGAEAPAHTLNLIWKQVFGLVDLWLEKQQIKRIAELEDFSNQVNKKLEEIPAENIQEPKMSILGPTIEAAQYYLEEEELRKMFAKLVASSFDNRNNEIIHNSFVQKLKSLSSDDAKLLKFIKGNPAGIAICEYYIQLDSGELRLSDVVCLAFGKQYTERSSISLYSLIHLGLIKINLERIFTQNDKYADFYETSLYFDLKQNNDVSNLKKLLEDQLKHISKDELASSLNKSLSELEDFLQEKEIMLKKGKCELTSLGKAFVDICCE